MADCVPGLWTCTFPQLVFVPERNLGINLFSEQQVRMFVCGYVFTNQWE